MQQKVLPTEKLIQALRRRMMKRSQIIWGTLPFNKEVKRGFVQPQLLFHFFSTSQKFHKAVDITLFSFLYGCKSRIVQQQCDYTHQNSSWFQNGPMLSCSKLDSEQQNQISILNCIVSLMPHKSIGCSYLDSPVFPPFSLLCQVQSSYRMGSGEGKEMGKAYVDYDFLSAMLYKETPSTFPLASLMLLLILWKDQKIWHL